MDFTLAYITSPRPDGSLNVILGKQKTGKWAGCFNGFGGVIPDSTAKWQAAQDKILKDTGITYSKKEINNAYKGEINFKEAGNSEGNQVTLYLFSTPNIYISSWHWKERHSVITPIDYHFITENEQMKPHLFSSDSLPYSKMPPHDHIWLPRLLLGHDIRADLTINLHSYAVTYEECSVFNWGYIPNTEE